MLKYNPNLKQSARRLRKEMTRSERALWSRLRRKQLRGVQFYRQKPIGIYIMDFYAPKSKLVVEVDGSQHLGSTHGKNDAERDLYLESTGLQELDAVVDVIFRTLRDSSGIDSSDIEGDGG